VPTTAITQQVLNMMNEAVYVCDTENNLLYINPAAERLSGYTQKETEGKKCWEVFGDNPPQGHAICPGDIAASMSAPEAQHNGKIINRNGEAFDLHMSISPFTDNGAVAGFVVVMHAVSQENQEQSKALSASKDGAEARTDLLCEESLFTGGPVVIVKWQSLQGWPVEYASGNIIRFGITSEALCSGTSSFADLIHPEDLKRVEREVAGHCDGDCQSHEQEYRILSPDGRTIWIHSLTNIICATDGTPLGRNSYLMDITARKRRENILLQQQARHEEVEALAHLGHWELNPVTREIFWSDETYRIFGIEPGTKIDFDFFIQCVHEEDRGEVVEAYNLSIQDKTQYNLEHKIVKADGSVAHVLEHCHTTYDDNGDPIVSLGTVLDITHRAKSQKLMLEAKEQAEAANRIKSQFLANMSHEVRTPMNGIMGMLQLLERTNLSGEQQELASMAMQSSKRLTRLLSDILDISKIEVGKLSLFPEPFNLVEMLLQTKELFMPAASQTGLKLNVHIAPEAHADFVGDPLRIEQILTNLIGNAIKFTPSGGITVEAIHLPPVNCATDRVLFTVTDTGIGIPDNKLSYLFHPFTQADANSTRQADGAGLGLSICKRLADIMNGTIAVASTLGEGTTFYLCIPLHPIYSKPTVAGANHDPAGLPPGLRILLAEDDRVSAIMGVRLLESLGNHVTAVSNGEQVIQAVRQEPYDIILMDVQMPTMDGVKATHAIRNGEAGLYNKDIQIIALTACAMAGDREAILQSGMDDYIAKPLEFAKLQNVLQSASQRGERRI